MNTLLDVYLMEMYKDVYLCACTIINPQTHWSGSMCHDAENLPMEISIDQGAIY